MRRPLTIGALAVATALSLGTSLPATAVSHRDGPGASKTTTTVAVDGNEVTVATVAPDGSGHATVTTFVSRRKADAASGRARRAGATLASVGTTDCAPFYGTASAACTGKWTYGAYNDPKVCAEDYTGTSWPVHDAQAEWYKAAGIDLYYHYFDGCSSSYHPVWVYEGNFGTDWYAQTYYVFTSSSHVYRKSATISLNNQITPKTYGARRSVACHELGHALGLGHNTSTASCMVDGPYFPQHPTSQDFTILTKVYPKAGT